MSDHRYQALVVDDEEFLRQIMTRALSKEGFDCSEAVDGKDGLDLIHRKNFDIVVTDMNMPNCTGHELALEVLAMPTRPAIVMLTGVIDPKLARDLIGQGIDDIAFKPIDYPTFAAKLQAIVDRRSLLEPRNNHAAIEQPRLGQPAAEADSPKAPHVEFVLSDEALFILEIVRSSEASTPELANAIQSAPELTSEILRRARALCYGRTTHVIGIEQAIIRIGRTRVASIVKEFYSSAINVR